MFSSQSKPIALLALLALVQGLVYLLLLPPWQHYDEPSHFEYAWLVAHGNLPPTADDVDGTMRREVATSMIAHDFYRGTTLPDVDQPDGTKISIGYSQFDKPPLYYVLVSLPLLVMGGADVVAQLYAARTVSLLVFVATILAVYGVVCELTPTNHPLRWLIPVVVALVPPFADLMTAVNSDVGAVAAFTVFLWGMVRTIRRGFNIRRIVWIALSVLVCAFVKNTSLIAVVLAPVGLLIAFWVARGWRWRYVVAACAGIGLVGMLAVFGWGDAQGWYRWQGWDQPSATRTANPDAVFGTHVITIRVGQGTRHDLLDPIPPDDVARFAGQTVTVAGWLWAERPATTIDLGLVWSADNQTRLDTLADTIELTDTPTFYARTVAVPENAGKLYYALIARRPTQGAQPTLVYLDGAVVVQGEQPAQPAPTFSDDTATRGTWNGQDFGNPLRNASGESAWPRVRPWFASFVPRVINRERLWIVTALFDWALVLPLAFYTATQASLYGLFGRFAWGHIALPAFISPVLFQLWALVAVVGCIFWWIRSKPAPTVRPALAFLACAGLSVWVSVSLWPLSYVLMAHIPLPSPRYLFPVMLPTVLVLVAGWRALWPRKLQGIGVGILVAMMVLLDLLAVSTIWSYYHAVV